MLFLHYVTYMSSNVVSATMAPLTSKKIVAIQQNETWRFISVNLDSW
jgi:hypothetical protein